MSRKVFLFFDTFVKLQVLPSSRVRQKHFNFAVKSMSKSFYFTVSRRVKISNILHAKAANSILFTLFTAGSIVDASCPSEFDASQFFN